MARSGRRPGRTETREEILAAARDLFARNGFDGTTIRAIAAAAGVNPALVHHFYGSKDEVFTAALRLPIDPQVMVAAILDGPRDSVGERLLRVFLGIWEQPQTNAAFFALLRSVATNEQAARMLRQFIERAVLARVAQALGVPPLRLTAMAAQVIGLAMVRYVVKVEPMAQASPDEIVALVGPVLQSYLDRS